MSSRAGRIRHGAGGAALRGFGGRGYTQLRTEVLDGMGRWQDGEGTLRLSAPHGLTAPDDVSNGPDPGSLPPVPLEIAASYRARTRGLLGRDGLTGALLLTPATSVHTVRMRFAIDVAYLDRRLRVLAVRTMPPGRLGRPRLRARHVLEAEAGAMERWGLRRGVRVEIDAG